MTLSSIEWRNPLADSRSRLTYLPRHDDIVTIDRRGTADYAVSILDDEDCGGSGEPLGIRRLGRKTKIQNVLGDDQGAIGIALLPYIKFPTARYGLGNGKVEGGFMLPLSFSAPAGFTIIVMPEGDILKNDVGNGYHVALDFLVNVSHPLDERWTISTEIFTTQSFDSHYCPVYTFDAALTHAISPNWQLDLGGNFGSNRVTPRDRVYAGLAQRF